MNSIDKVTLVKALDEKLCIANFSDVSNNGLQVDSTSNRISKVCTGVDASLPFFEAAAERGADMVVCHHGISWGDSLKYMTGLNFRLVECLMRHHIALWACHLPLDAHPELGNNACLCDVLGLDDRKPFGFYHGQYIGFRGSLPKPVSREALAELLRLKVSPRLDVHPFGTDEIRTVGVISGGGSDSAAEAAKEGLDAFVTGESNLGSHNFCLQSGLNLFASGHYATERFGVRAVGDWIAKTFGISHEFIDFDIPY